MAGCVPPYLSRCATMGYMQVSSNVSTFHVGTMFATVAMVPRVLWRCCNTGSGMGKMYLGSDVVSCRCILPEGSGHVVSQRYILPGGCSTLYRGVASCRYVAPGCTSDTIT